MLTDAAAISCMRPKRCTSSGWCRLVPVLFSLFSFVRPRRYVELGVHSGMSFFSACQASEHLELDADCIGIDSWLGDEHAGLQEPEVFSDVIEYLKQNYPDQSIIQTYFESALGCFESGSIDLLNIDGLHTYAAAKRDFESWLPKMSETGVIIFCETNVHEQNFGVWRLWGELSKRYPAFNFRHRHGLGILYVGSKPSPIAECLKLLQVDSGYAVLAQSYFESIGPLVSEDRTNLAELESLRAALKAERDGFDRARNEAHVAREEVKSLHERFDNLQVRYDQRLADLHARYYAVLNSTTWLMTAPARALLTPLPGVRRVIRRSMKLGWWTVTGQLLRRYRVWRDAGRDQAGV
jgi:hypothetical protein